ncbi:MAG: succinate dehydrogenase assembly factor 2 [Burkholderiales bacterium]|nr:succinate dehydrogenase assembly factor 2 [Burkholderiales bacterium]
MTLTSSPQTIQGSAPDPDELRRLRWRCRRGLLENDLFIDRFFELHGENLSAALVQGLHELMDLSDNDLLDLFLARKQPQGNLDTVEVRQVLELMHAAGASRLPSQADVTIAR